jgi:diaminohydroxyphosphoribosylaminopyrimidine deaminase/5-amino-6-(5-phosphoribosylamino)uracil reductase
MAITPQDELHLTRALALAGDAVGLASPNPTVGCVIARGERVLGQGAHLYDGRDHAEIVAIQQAAAAKQSVHGATAYVTLEPCSHRGRTGPCAEALIAAGIARCVVATIDPNPLVSGNGVAKLRAAGREVLLLDPAEPLAVRARQLNDAFAFSIRHDRPFVTLKAALSVDGMIAPPSAARNETAPHWLTGAAARADAQRLRHAADAVLTGIGTVLADNPKLTDRTGLQRRRPLLRVVVDAQLRTPLESALVASAQSDLLIACCSEASAARQAALTARGAEVIQLAAHHGHLHLNDLLAHLATRHILNVLVEAGSGLNGSLLRANLIDSAVLYYAEQELGVDATAPAADHPLQFSLGRDTQRRGHPHRRLPPRPLGGRSKPCTLAVCSRGSLKPRDAWPP